MGTVDDIGGLPSLASPLASYVSGCVVVVDGGQNLLGSTLFNMGSNGCFVARKGADHELGNPQRGSWPGRRPAADDAMTEHP
jgi:hypothetical protein